MIPFWNRHCKSKSITYLYFYNHEKNYLNGNHFPQTGLMIYHHIKDVLFCFVEFKLTRGLHRNVVLIGNYAIKFPRTFLGLTSNINEVVRWKYDLKRRHLRCPVLYGSSIV